MVLESMVDKLLSAYFNFLSVFSAPVRVGLEIIIIGLGIALVSFFIWKFYTSISKRDLFDLDLAKYNNAKNPTLDKVLAILLYVLEYLIIIPLLLLIWFGVLTLVMSLIATDITTYHLFAVIAAMLIAIRTLSYFNDEISKDLAKLFPFTALAIFIISTNEIESISILNRLYDVPSLFNNLLIFFLSIFAVEIVLRIGYSMLLIARGDAEEAFQS